MWGGRKASKGGKARDGKELQEPLLKPEGQDQAAGRGGEAALADVSLLDFVHAVRSSDQRSEALRELVSGVSTPSGDDTLIQLVRRLHIPDPAAGGGQRGCAQLSLRQVLKGVLKPGAPFRVLDCGAIEGVPAVSGEAVAKLLQEAGFVSLPQLLFRSGSRDAAIMSTNVDSARGNLSHKVLSEFIGAGGGLWECGVGVGMRVGVLLPNGPEMASCMLLCMSVCCAVPINYQQTAPEVIADLERTGCVAIIIQEGEDDQGIRESARLIGVTVIDLSVSVQTSGYFSLSAPLPAGGPPGRGAFNAPGDTVLVLHTSGTSGTKKMVPYSLECLVVGAACIIETWGLTEDDVAFNMMPLFHVGGIARSLLAPVLAGGSVVAASGFDPATFWSVSEQLGVSWYYAGPTMHQLLLEELAGGDLPEGVRLRMVSNASGGLLPSLALRMRETLKCPILPSYGMTECMPISSPPVAYNLERHGTSGQMVGPAARIYGDAGRPLPAGEIGNICVRGLPLMKGYQGSETANEGAFVDGGWFNTGDMGYIDAEGWIFLTGRSKEVINRGGEIISPFEVEEVLLGHDRVQSVLAFSAPHEALQEVVGCVVVPEPDLPRLNLIGLQKYASEFLHPSKWPQVLVFMDELPKGQANKAQRIKLSERCGIKSVRETEAQTQRMYEAKAPPRGSGLDVVINTKVIGIDLTAVMTAMNKVKRQFGIEQIIVISGHHSHRKDAVCAYLTPETVDTSEFEAAIRHHLHDYLVPLEIITLESLPQDPSSLPLPDLKGLLTEYVAPTTPTQRIVQDIWSFVLGRDPSDPLSMHADFFEHGGSSLLAGRLIAKVRSALGVPMTAAAIFQSRTIAQLAAKADEMGAKPDANYKPLSAVRGDSAHAMPQAKGGGDAFDDDDENIRDKRWGRQTRPWVLFVQALPLCVIYPIRRIFTWLVFVTLWLYLQVQLKVHRLPALVVALLMERLICEVVLPLTAILLKWIIIGRYREGSYKFWASYYLRWYLVENILLTCGRGLFRHSQAGLRFYYILLGARIGKGVVFSPGTRLAEFDLIEVGAGTVLDDVIVRAFCIEACRMRLAPVRIGKNCSICAKVSLAPGHTVPSGACLGPLSSTYHLTPEQLAKHNRAFNVATFPQPPWYMQLLSYPLLLMAWCLVQIPVLLVLRVMCLQPWYKNELADYYDVLEWFVTPSRIGYYVALRTVRVAVQPFIRVFCGVAIKWLVIGKFTPGKRSRSKLNLWKHWMMAKALPGKHLHEIAHLVGVHGEGVSVILRMLGAKIGKRIYWPGSGFQHLVEFDLLEVGDDVVFGSRSIILCADAEDAMHVRILAGANIADRCVLLPGCLIGKNALLGSGGLATKGQTLPAGSKWVGCKQGSAVLLEEGDVEMAMASDTIRPYGKAMHLRQANYWVMPSWLHGLISTLARCFAAAYRACTLSLSLCFTWLIIFETPIPVGPEFSWWDLVGTIVPTYMIVQNCATLVAIAISIGLKWAIMGRRQAGNYDWDTSSYCQRWNVYLASVHLIRAAYFGRGILEYLHGSAFLVWYFRALGSRIGRDVCLYPTGADPMMTEPDLIVLGDEACVDRASLVAHINSAGHFQLNKTVVGARATLRSDSRLLSGATMMQRSTLLEHTLVMGGEVVDEGSTWQGWPGQMVVATLPSAEELGPVVVVVEGGDDRSSHAVREWEDAGVDDSVDEGAPLLGHTERGEAGVGISIRGRSGEHGSAVDTSLDTSMEGGAQSYDWAESPTKSMGLVAKLKEKLPARKRSGEDRVKVCECSDTRLVLG